MPDADAAAWQHTTLTTDRHATSGTRTRNPNKRTAALPRLRPRGHRDRPSYFILTVIWTTLKFRLLKEPLKYVVIANSFVQFHANLFVFSFFLSFLNSFKLPHCSCRGLLRHLITLNKTHTHTYTHTHGRTPLDEGSAPSQKDVSLSHINKPDQLISQSVSQQSAVHILLFTSLISTVWSLM